MTIGKGLVLTDGEVIDGANRACAFKDQTTTLAPAGSAHAERLARLTANLRNEDGLQLEFKAYMLDELNAWAMPNGCVRVYSGLLDAFSDDEVLGVLGHEIGHVKLGHTKAKMRTALLARGARESAAGTAAGTIAFSELGDLAEKVVNAQFSQKEEKAADDYGFDFLVKHSHDPSAMVRMFRKLPGKKGGLLASHPDPESRAQRIEARLKKQQ
ncbi:MAG TPA: M48 family metalloprotease [Vicinamibacterales bacterium]